MKILTTCLWFDDQAEEAANFYISVFKNGKINSITRYLKEGFEHHGRPEGSVMTVEFEMNGQKFVGINGGPIFTFSEAFSLVVSCDNQAEIDYYWQALREGGGQEGPCGWLKDRYGFSWQVAPTLLHQMLLDPDKTKVARVTNAFMQMKKFDIKKLQAAFDGR